MKVFLMKVHNYNKALILTTKKSA